jgi:hypothetical protein
MRLDAPSRGREASLGWHVRCEHPGNDKRQAALPVWRRTGKRGFLETEQSSCDLSLWRLRRVRPPHWQRWSDADRASDAGSSEDPHGQRTPPLPASHRKGPYALVHWLLYDTTGEHVAPCLDAVRWIDDWGPRHRGRRSARRRNASERDLPGSLGDDSPERLGARRRCSVQASSPQCVLRRKRQTAGHARDHLVAKPGSWRYPSSRCYRAYLRATSSTRVEWACLSASREPSLERLAHGR